MNTKQLLACLLAVACLSGVVTAQASKTFKARLGPVPVEAATSLMLTGASGDVTAVLTGNRLVVNGTFKGLKSPATIAQLHVAPKATRGPAMLDLVVTKATSGMITGDLMLTPIQVDHLMRTRLYVQVHSEKSPEGHLWGWLLP